MLFLIQKAMSVSKTVKLTIYETVIKWRSGN